MNNYARMGGRKKGKVEDGSQIAEYLKADKGFMDGIRKGVTACKEGRVRPWSEIKRGLNL